MADNPTNSLRAGAFRQNIRGKLEEAIRMSVNPKTKILSSAEMETHIFQKAKTREEYLGFATRLLTHIQEMNLPYTVALQTTDAPFTVKEERPDTPPEQETESFSYSFSPNPSTSQTFNINENAEDEETYLDDTPAVTPRAKRRRMMEDTWDLELKEHELRMKVMQKKLELLDKKLCHEDDYHALRMKNLEEVHSTQMTATIDLHQEKKDDAGHMGSGVRRT